MGTSDIINYRLPNNTRPLFYNLRVDTEIHQEQFSFEGYVRILISVQEMSRSITLHARQLLFLDMNLLNMDESIYDTDLRFTYDSATDFLTIILNRDMLSGALHFVDIRYVGFLGDFNDRGFFRSSYVDADTNVTHWLASTQFQVGDNFP